MNYWKLCDDISCETKNDILELIETKEVRSVITIGADDTPIQRIDQMAERSLSKTATNGHYPEETLQERRGDREL